MLEVCWGRVTGWLRRRRRYNYRSLPYVLTSKDSFQVTYKNTQTAPATLISLQRSHIFCAYMLCIKYTDDNIESWYCLCRAGSSFRNVLTHLCDHKVPIVQALCGGLSAGSVELGESSRRRSCVWNWWGLDPKQKWNVNQLIRVSSKLKLIQSSYMLGHTFLFYVLQDFVLKIAYGRSKKKM